MTDITAQLHDTVLAAVRKVFPLMVAEELRKLSNGAARSGKPNGEVRERIVALLKEGKRPSEIADEIGCAVGYVFKIRKGSLGYVDGDKTVGAAPAVHGPMQAALNKHGNKRAAAKSLGMAETTYRERLKAEKTAA